MDALALRAARVRAREVDLEALDVAAEPVALRAEVADLRHEDGRVRGEGLAPRRLGPRRGEQRQEPRLGLDGDGGERVALLDDVSDRGGRGH